MATSNRDRISKALETLKEGLQPFVERELAAHFDEETWAQKTVETSRARLDVDADGVSSGTTMRSSR